MDAASHLRAARQRAGLTQAELATRAGTSQAAVSQYERGAKEPTLSTLARLLAGAGSELRVGELGTGVVRPTAAQLERAGSDLERVIELASMFPTRHAQQLPVPVLPAGRGS